MAAQKNINGVAFKDVTRIMLNIEKIINWYNRRYNFQIEKGTPKEQREYYNLLKRWDLLKFKRDQLQAG